MATLFQRIRSPAEAVPPAPIPEPTTIQLAGRAALARARSLARLVEGEIVPRLLTLRRPQPFELVVQKVTMEDIDRVADLALDGEAHGLIEQIDALLARGLAADTVLVDLLAPAARRLGEDWEQDRRDFVEVTMGLWRLQQAVHDVSRRDAGAQRGGRTALFTPMPGDQHSFGTVVVEEVFARGGWTTQRLTDPAPSDIHARLDRDWIDVLGLTVSCDAHSGALPLVITAARSVSRNPRLIVLVGGRVFSADPSLALKVGADGTAADARDALALADRLVGAIAREERLPA